MSGSVAITVDHVSKRYRRYHERNQSLKAAVLRGRRARYEEFWALDDVSFDVRSGSTFGIVGENGSGKSTLLKCMARILRPDRGEILVRGSLSALLELGAGFHPELSGRENVYLNGSILGLTRRDVDQRFDSIVDFSGLAASIDSPVKNYSSGMYVRLGFAVAISVDPEILLVDEVLAVGDAEFQLRCLEKIKEFREAGHTIVLVSHSLDLVRNTCDEAALLERGVIHRVGSAASVIDEYLADVFGDRVRDGEHGVRWGSGEIEITRAELIGNDGRVVQWVRSCDPVVIRCHLEAREPVARVVVGWLLQTSEGNHLASSHTKMAGLQLSVVEGGYVVEFAIDAFAVGAGHYDLSFSVSDDTHTHTYDHRQHLLRFEVSPGLVPTFGVVALPAKVSVSEATDR